MSKINNFASWKFPALQLSVPLTQIVEESSAPISSGNSDTSSVGSTSSISKILERKGGVVTALRKWQKIPLDHSPTTTTGIAIDSTKFSLMRRHSLTLLAKEGRNGFLTGSIVCMNTEGSTLFTKTDTSGKSSGTSRIFLENGTKVKAPYTVGRDGKLVLSGSGYLRTPEGIKVKGSFSEGIFTEGAKQNAKAKLLLASAAAQATAQAAAVAGGETPPLHRHYTADIQTYGADVLVLSNKINTRAGFTPVHTLGEKLLALIKSLPDNLSASEAVDLCALLPPKRGTKNGPITGCQLMALSYLGRDARHTFTGEGAPTEVNGANILRPAGLGVLTSTTRNRESFAVGTMDTDSRLHGLGLFCPNPSVRVRGVFTNGILDGPGIITVKSYSGKGRIQCNDLTGELSIAPCKLTKTTTGAQVPGLFVLEGSVFVSISLSKDSWLLTQDGKIWANTEEGGIWLASAEGRKWLKTESGKIFQARQNRELDRERFAREDEDNRNEEERLHPERERLLAEEMEATRHEVENRAAAVRLLRLDDNRRLEGDIDERRMLQQERPAYVPALIPPPQERPAAETGARRRVPQAERPAGDDGARRRLQQPERPAGADGARRRLQQPERPAGDAGGARRRQDDQGYDSDGSNFESTAL